MRLLQGERLRPPLTITYLPVETLSPNDYNPNVHDAGSFDMLVASLKVFGFTQPIVADRETKIIIDGENRWRAACVLGMREVPVVLLTFTEAERKAATIIHNRARGSEQKDRIADLEAEIEGLSPQLSDELFLKDRTA